MQAPAQALYIPPGEATRNLILNGRKQCGVVIGNVAFRTDEPIMLCCHIEPWIVQADIVAVRHCMLRDVTPKEYRGEGCDNPAGLLAKLRQFRPNLSPASRVTIVSWQSPRGRLVSERQAGRPA